MGIPIISSRLNVLFESFELWRDIPSTRSPSIRKRSCKGWRRRRLDLFTMSGQELQRIEVLSEVLARRRTEISAAAIVGLSTRQTRRLLAVYRDGLASPALTSGGHWI
jgi:hypothetical protein